MDYELIFWIVAVIVGIVLLGYLLIAGGQNEEVSDYYKERYL